jgi:hypothetical protein
LDHIAFGKQGKVRATIKYALGHTRSSLGETNYWSFQPSFLEIVYHTMYIPVNYKWMEEVAAIHSSHQMTTLNITKINRFRNDTYGLDFVRESAERWRAEAPQGLLVEKKKLMIQGTIASVAGLQDVAVSVKKRVESGEVLFRCGLFLFRLWQEGGSVYIQTLVYGMHLSSYYLRYSTATYFFLVFFIFIFVFVF